MFSKYDYQDLKLTKKYLEETEGFNVYYFNEFINSNLELIISGYIVLRRKWYSKELYEIEFEYNYNKKEFELIFPSEFNNLFDRWKLTENNTIFTKDYFLEKIQKYINDALYDEIDIKEYGSFDPYKVFTPINHLEILKELSKKDELFVWQLELKEED